MKRCSCCGISKHVSAFGLQKDSKRVGKFYPRAECKACRGAKEKQRTSQEPPEQKLRRKDKHRYRTYGLTRDGYNQLFASQEGRCAACNKHQADLPKALCVDHDHISLKVRGLLCANCNLALGLVHDDADRLLSLIEYIRRVKV